MNKNEQHIINLINLSIRQKNPTAEIILFGSHARGNAHVASDWDILILLNNLIVDWKIEKELREALFEIELEIGEPISTFVFSKNDWETKHAITPLYTNIMREGIQIK